MVIKITGTIKPIETVYNGYRFRSRLEARWAVFFDALEIKYEYEPEGFNLGNGVYYLPDFLLHNIITRYAQKDEPRDIYVEVKGIMTNKDRHKIEQFSEELNVPVAIGCSDMIFISPANWGNAYSVGDFAEMSYLGRCNKCGTLYFISENGSYTSTCCGFYDGDRTFNALAYGDKPTEKPWKCDNKITSAFLKAKQARFEHGETP